MKRFYAKSSNKLTNFVIFQVLLLSTFIGFVYADRVTIEMVFKPLEAIEEVWIFHHVFFQVLATIVFTSISLAYWLGGGNWKLSLGGFMQLMVLTHTGVEDYLYYVLFGERIPKLLTWLSWNGYLVKTSQLAALFPVTSEGLGLGVVLSILFIGIMWSLLLRKTKVERTTTRT